MANFHYFWVYIKYVIFRLRKAPLGINLPTFGAIIMRHVSTLHIKYISWFFGWIEVSYDKIFTPTPIDFGEKSGKNIDFFYFLNLKSSSEKTIYMGTWYKLIA